MMMILDDTLYSIRHVVAKKLAMTVLQVAYSDCEI